MKKIKRGRGRPKGSKNSKVPKKRGRGRPKGSKNKVNKSQKVKKVKKVKKSQKVKKVKKVKNTPKKRGRPKGSKNAWKKKPHKPYKSYNEPEGYVLPKTYKLLGYCNGRGCDCIIGSMDLESKFIFVCPSCGKRDRIRNIKKSKKDTPKPPSKKEYLSETRSAHNDMPPLNEPKVNMTPDVGFN